MAAARPPRDGRGGLADLQHVGGVRRLPAPRALTHRRQVARSIASITLSTTVHARVALVLGRDDPPRRRARGRCARTSPRAPPRSRAARSRLRQSSSVSFQRLSGSSRRASKRRTCSSRETCIQNFTSTMPSAHEHPLERDDLVVGALPLLLRREPSTRSTSTRPYHERSSTAMPPQPGSAGQKRCRKWWRFSSGVGAANCATRTWRGSSGVDEPLDRAALAARVPALEHHAHRRPELARRRSARRAAGAASSRRRWAASSCSSPCVRPSLRVRSTSSSRAIVRVSQRRPQTAAKTRRPRGPPRYNGGTVSARLRDLFGSSPSSRPTRDGGCEVHPKKTVRRPANRSFRG